jgi:hypothetical protein
VNWGFPLPHLPEFPYARHFAHSIQLHSILLHSGEFPELRKPIPGNGGKLMKLFAPVSIGVLSLLLGAPAFISAQDDAKPKQDEPKAQDQVKPPQGDEDRPKDMKPQDAKPQETKPGDNKREDEKTPKNESTDHPEQNAGAAHPQSAHIPDDKFRAHFGREHTVVIKQPVIVGGQPRFQSGGYWFIISDPWPAGWAYTDTCYVDYIDGEYFLFDLLHPGVRVALVVVM